MEKVKAPKTKKGASLLARVRPRAPKVTPPPPCSLVPGFQIPHIFPPKKKRFASKAFFSERFSSIWELIIKTSSPPKKTDFCSGRKIKLILIRICVPDFELSHGWPLLGPLLGTPTRIVMENKNDYIYYFRRFWAIKGALTCHYSEKYSRRKVTIVTYMRVFYFTANY